MTDVQPKAGMRWIVKRETRYGTRTPDGRPARMWAVRGYVPLEGGKRATTHASYFHRLEAAHAFALTACRRKYGRTS